MQSFRSQAQRTQADLWWPITCGPLPAAAYISSVNPDPARSCDDDVLVVVYLVHLTWHHHPPEHPILMSIPTSLEPAFFKCLA